jgi:hypothetical protein
MEDVVAAGGGGAAGQGEAEKKCFHGLSLGRNEEGYVKGGSVVCKKIVRVILQLEFRFR